MPLPTLNLVDGNKLGLSNGNSHAVNCCKYVEPDGSTYFNDFTSTLDSGWSFDTGSKREARTDSGELQFRELSSGTAVSYTDYYFRRTADLSTWSEIILEARVSQTTPESRLWGIVIGGFGYYLGDNEIAATYITPTVPFGQNNSLIYMRAQTQTGGAPVTNSNTVQIDIETTYRITMAIHDLGTGHSRWCFHLDGQEIAKETGWTPTFSTTEKFGVHAVDHGLYYSTDWQRCMHDISLQVS